MLYVWTDKICTNEKAYLTKNLDTKYLKIDIPFVTWSVLATYMSAIQHMEVASNSPSIGLEFQIILFPRH